MFGIYQMAVRKRCKWRVEAPFLCKAYKDGQRDVNAHTSILVKCDNFPFFNSVVDVSSDTYIK